MAKQTYNESLENVLEFEGGYTNDAADPGGPTNWGITIVDARMYWKKDATADDIRKMPLSVAKEIYRSKYWDAMRCDEMPPGVDFALFDYGVNSGISRSAKVVQRILGVVVDGKIGLVTLTAIHKSDSQKLIKDICDERLAFLQGLGTWSVFGRGWGRRVSEVRTWASGMANKYPIEPLPVPVMAPTPTPAASLEVVTQGAKAFEPTLAEENSLPKSKSIWGSLLGFVTSQGGVFAGFFDKLDNPYTLTAFLVIVVLICAGFYMALKGRFDIQAVLEQSQSKN